MLKREKVVQELIANGYDENLVAELPKLFIEDYLEKEKEDLSEIIDIFIDKVQSGEAINYYNEDENIYFGSVEKIEESDSFPNASNNVFSHFKEEINENFMEVIKRRPLRNILLNAGVLKLDGNELKYYKDIIPSSDTFSDLCEVCCICYDKVRHSYNFQIIYITLSNFLLLMESKGIKKEDIINGTCVSSNISEKEVFINYDAIMAIGNTLDNAEEYVPKMKPENN